MALQPVGFGRDQRAGDDRRVHLAGAAASQRTGDKTFGFGNRQRRHRAPYCKRIRPPVAMTRMTSVVAPTVAMWRQPSMPIADTEVPRPSAPIAIRSPSVEASTSTVLILA